MGTVDRMGGLMCELATHYIPCKGRVYLVPGSLPKCITILKQLARLYGHMVRSQEHTVNKEKIIVYRLCPCGSRPSRPEVQVKPKVSACYVRTGPHHLSFQ
jgi:hypothetical protein